MEMKPDCALETVPCLGNAIPSPWKALKGPPWQATALCNGFSRGRYGVTFYVTASMPGYSVLHGMARAAKSLVFALGPEIGSAVFENTLSNIVTPVHSASK
jgi:hypothetical protein